jgi:hypothetical protein
MQVNVQHILQARESLFIDKQVWIHINPQNVQIRWKVDGEKQLIIEV